MDVLRTPDERFEGLSGYGFEPHYFDVAAEDGTALRVHYLDEGPEDGAPILCMHGQPSWSFLYRNMIPILVDAGYRVYAPDLVGFGRSDKPASMEDYSYSGHVDWMEQWLTGLDLRNLTLVCQDWGGLIGLRLVGSHPDRFARLVVANTGLPGSERVTDEMSTMLEQMYPAVPVPSAQEVAEQFQSGNPGAFLYWVKYAAESPDFTPRAVFEALSQFEDGDMLDGYSAPFPDERFFAGARRFPSLLPFMPHQKADRDSNDRAWTVLEKFEKPVLTAFTDDDPVTAARGKAVPGTRSRCTGPRACDDQRRRPFPAGEKAGDLCDRDRRFHARNDLSGTRDAD